MASKKANSFFGGTAILAAMTAFFAAARHEEKN